MERMFSRSVIVVEPLFITDPFEGSIAASANGQQVIAAGLAQAVNQYFASAATPAGAVGGARLPR
jgi:N-acetylmuramoyl-L-alanine amidase